MSNSGRPDRSLLKTIVLGGVVFAVSFLLVLPGVNTVVGANDFEPLDEARLRALAARSTIYDAAGNVIAVLGKENREPVDLDEVPKVIQDAVIAVEDQTFWTNDGVDVNGMMRAAVNNLTTGEVQGGSTITQQLVKNRILSPKRDVRRKMREIVLAVRMNDALSKREILEQYLNTVYFGQGSYGVKSAVERFFLAVDEGAPFPRGKQLDEVTLGEAALLAGLISNPEGNNPFVFPERAIERRALALELMLEQGYITPEEAAAANKEPIPSVKPVPELRPRNAWAEEIQDRLINDPTFSALGPTADARREAVLTGGLRIHATLDPAMQTAAQGAIDAILPEKPGFTGALIAMDPQTGYVKAMVAGPGFEQSQYNIATSYPGRQSGSTWKVITLAAALANGFSPNDRVDGSSPCQFEQWGQTANAEGGGGVMTLRAATANSVNCAFARTQLAVGFDKVIPLAQEMGITQQTLQPILTLTLGTIETTPLEMASVTSTIAAGGRRHPPLFVSKIEGPDGKVVFDGSTVPGKQVLSPEVAACEIDLLRGVVAGGTGTAARLDGRPVFGKTGTTDNKADANFLGATPQLATFVWHGNATARVPGAGFGGQIPARIFKAFMDAALAGAPVVDFPPPGPVCDRPGMFIKPEGRSKDAPAVAGTAPTTVPTVVVPVAPPPTAPPSTTPPTGPPTTAPGGGGAGTDGGSST
jgi:penicillin-binding protein 1A